MQLRGKYAACDNNQKMNLWHISGNSPLIRDEMLQKDYCWKTFEGLRVDVLQTIGEFARVQNLKEGAVYIVYRADLERIKAQPKNSSREIKFLKLISIKNLMFNHDRTELNNLMPVVLLKFSVDAGLNVEYEFVKTHIKAGLDEEQRMELL